MEKSESIGKLAAALAKAQGQIKEAKRDSANPFFKTTYADLGAIWEACREALVSNGLAVIQVAENGGDGLVSVSTILAHESGEWIGGALTLKPVKDDPQGAGSAITYARRYGLAAIVGVAPGGDDDGEAATGRGTASTHLPAKSPTRAKAPAPAEPSPQTPTTRPTSGRPFMPDALKADLEARVKALTQRGVAEVSDGQRGLVAASLELCFAGDANAKQFRHSVQMWLSGSASVNDMPAAWVRVLLGWLNPQKDEGGDYIPSPFAVKEAKLVLRQSLVDAGQLDLLNSAIAVDAEQQA